MNNNKTIKSLMKQFGFVKLKVNFFLLMLIFMMVNAVFAGEQIRTETARDQQRTYLNHKHVERIDNYLESHVHDLRSVPYLIQTYQLIDHKIFTKAKQLLKESLTNDPSDHKVRMAYLNLLYQLKEYQDVIQQSNVAVKEQDELPVILYRALAKNASANHEGALSDLNLIVNNNKARLEDKQFALNVSVFILLEQNSFQKALKMLGKFPRHIQEYDYFMRYAIAEEGTGDLDYAKQNYQAALSKAKSDTESVQTYYALGKIYQSQKMTDKALNAYQSALKLNSKDPDILRSLAHIYNNNNQFEKAVVTIKQVLDQDFDINDQEFLANAQFASKDYSAAAKSYQYMLEHLTDNKYKYRAYMLLGYSYNKSNQLTQAIQAFQHASELRKSIPTLYSLAAALESKGEISRAITLYTRLVTEDPKSSTYIKLSNLYLKSGDINRALMSIDSALLLGLPDAKKKDVYISQGELFYKAKQYESAKIAFDKAANINSKDPALFNWLAMTSLKLGLHEEASAYQRKALSLDESINAMFTLAEIEKNIDDSNQPMKIYRHLAQLRGLSKEQRSTALENIGMLYLQQDQQQLAIGYLRAASEREKDKWQLNRNLGIALARYEQWADALEQFKIVLSKQKNPENYLNIARIYKAIDQPEIANTYYNNALKLAEQSADKNKTIQVLDELGYFYADQNINEKAQEVWEKSLVLHKNPVIEMQLAKLAELNNGDEELLTQQENLNSHQLTSEQHAEQLDNLAQGYAKKRLFQRAIDAQQRALVIKETPARHYLLGSYFQSIQKKQDALHHLRAASDQQPDNDTYAKALALASTQDENKEQSNEWLENHVENKPENLELLKERAYSKLRNSDNDEAEYWFKQAIDARMIQLGERRYGDIEKDEEINSLKKEVGDLTNHFDITAYYGYRSNDNTKISAGIPSALGGVIPSQGGVEFSYRPPVIGLRDGRTFHLFSRLLWSMKPNSFNLDSKSFQGSVGLSYQPFKSHDFNISAEKLFKVGKNAQNNWLIRGLYQWADGSEFQKGREHWNYTSLFTDLGYFVKSPGVLSFFGEFRQGYNYNLWDLVLTPHAVIDGRIQTHDDEDLSYLEAGVGLSFKYFFNQTRYRVPQSYVELLFQYKAGIVNIDNGVNATGILRF